ncbi:MAG: STAS domain-containing protein [Spirochaetes bacterium]|nr:STAS domain-containing protein [Spirochaetota bacterium]
MAQETNPSFALEQTGEIMVVRLSGSFDTSNCNLMRTAVTDAMAKGGIKAVVMNLRNVTSIDSAAIGALIALRRGFVPPERFRLCEISDRIDKVIRLSHLDGIFFIDALEESAKHQALRA